ncbi:ATP-binding protein [Streptomyces viridifaciens]|nr:ATP-binding protein [Streptomyces viridifaciens]
MKGGQRGLIHRLTINATATQLDGRLAAVNPVRDVLATVLSRWGVTEPDLGDVLLVADELVANAARHSPPGRHHASLHLSPDGDRIVVTVHDLSRAMPRLSVDALGNDDVESGRGLLVVAALSVNWGAVVTAGGKKVWAELALGKAVRVSPPSRAAERARVISETVRVSRLCAVPRRQAIA